ncbi:hypothetical protein GJ496_001653 [Pomphorhynchus laevis]|nr:hypothetical protein GJ496_001653 [Pomphorhynchus laevis]
MQSHTRSKPPYVHNPLFNSIPSSNRLSPKYTSIRFTERNNQQYLIASLAKSINNRRTLDSSFVDKVKPPRPSAIKEAHWCTAVGRESITNGFDKNKDNTKYVLKLIPFEENYCR